VVDLSTSTAVSTTEAAHGNIGVKFGEQQRLDIWPRPDHLEAFSHRLKSMINFFRLLNHIISRPLNDGAKLAALSRFLRWQIASRIIKRPISLPFIGDTSLLVQTGMTGATQNWYGGLTEPSEMGFSLHALRPGDLFLDIGANVGSYTILAGGVVKASVICVEPVPSTFQHLQTNIRLNELKEIETHCCGLSSVAGELLFTSHLDTMNRVALPGETLPTVSVPVTTLDALLQGRIPTIIKIDVEGHELAVLKGGTETLSSPGVDAVIMETNGSGEKFGVTDDALFEMMRGFGFQPAEYDPYNRRLVPHSGGAQNTIFVKNFDRIGEQCSHAPRYQLVNGTI
jgi:FkbM family methyltransferase